MANYPFVDYKRWPVQDIDSTPTLIFGNDQTNCIIEGLFITNTTNNIINVNVYMLYEDEDGNPIEHYLVKSLKINALDSVDFLKGNQIIVKSEDTIFAYSDFSGNLFNTYVSYIELNQTPIVNP